MAELKLHKLTTSHNTEPITSLSLRGGRKENRLPGSHGTPSPGQGSPLQQRRAAFLFPEDKRGTGKEAKLPAKWVKRGMSTIGSSQTKLRQGPPFSLENKEAEESSSDWPLSH